MRNRMCVVSQNTTYPFQFIRYYFRVEVPTEKRVKRWALSMEELMSDPTGEYSFEILHYT